MSVISSYNLNNRLKIDNLDQNNSAATEPSNKFPTVAQRVGNLAYQTCMAPANFGVNFLKGATIWTGVQTIASPIKCFKTFYYTFFNPTFTNCKNVTPIEMLLDNRWLIEPVVVKAPIFHEVLFRGLLQDVILKQGVKKAVALVSPKHAELVDSKVYTAARILITSALYSFYREVNYRSNLAIANFLYGLGFGILKEKYGLASAVGAHMLNAFVLTAGDLFSRCKV